jgi:hypothetical protein
MDEKGNKAWTATLERVEEAHRELENDFPDKAADNDDDENHSSHSSSQSSSETILDEVREFTSLSDRVLHDGAAGHEPIVASQSDDEANGILQSSRVPSPGSSEIEVTSTLDPEDSRSFDTGTARAPRRRRRRSERPRRNARSSSGDSGRASGPRINPGPQAAHNIGGMGYFGNSTVTPYSNYYQNAAASSNYWTYGYPIPSQSNLPRDPRFADYYGRAQEHDPSRNEIDSRPPQSTPLDRVGSALCEEPGAGWAGIPASAQTASPIRPDSPLDPHASHPKTLKAVTADQPTARARLMTQPLGHERLNIQSDGLAFAVSVQCSHATLHSRFSTLLHQHWPERTAHNDSGDVWVRKAVSSKRFKQRDGLHSVELACHAGPMSTDAEEYQIQWLYVHCIQKIL